MSNHTITITDRKTLEAMASDDPEYRYIDLRLAHLSAGGWVAIERGARGSVGGLALVPTDAYVERGGTREVRGRWGDSDLWREVLEVRHGRVNAHVTIVHPNTKGQTTVTVPYEQVPMVTVLRQVPNREASEVLSLLGQHDQVQADLDKVVGKITAAVEAGRWGTVARLAPEAEELDDAALWYRSVLGRATRQEDPIPVLDALAQIGTLAVDRAITSSDDAQGRGARRFIRSLHLHVMHVPALVPYSEAPNNQDT